MISCLPPRKRVWPRETGCVLPSLHPIRFVSTILARLEKILQKGGYDMIDIYFLRFFLFHVISFYLAFGHRKGIRIIDWIGRFLRTLQPSLFICVHVNILKGFPIFDRVAKHMPTKRKKWYCK